MSRNLKQGLEYFSIDTNWDRKMSLFKAKFGLQGVGFIVELWKTIYNEGYYIIWDEETQLLFADGHGIDISQVSEMMVFAIGKELFRIFKIRNQPLLTSSGIQKRYLQASLKRKEIHFIEEILLISTEKPAWSKAEIIYDSLNRISESEKGIKESEKGIKESEKGISDTKVKESKGKESKVKKGNIPEKIKESGKGISESESKPKPAEAPPTPPPRASASEVISPQPQNPKPETLQGIDNEHLRSKKLQAEAEYYKIHDEKAYSALLKKHPELEEEVPWT